MDVPPSFKNGNSSGGVLAGGNQASGYMDVPSQTNGSWGAFQDDDVEEDV